MSLLVMKIFASSKLKTNDPGNGIGLHLVNFNTKYMSISKSGMSLEEL